MKDKYFKVILIGISLLFIFLLIPYTLTIPNTTPFLTPNEVKRLYPNSTTIIDTFPNLRITINIILIGLVIIISVLIGCIFKINNKIKNKNNLE